LLTGLKIHSGISARVIGVVLSCMGESEEHFSAQNFWFFERGSNVSHIRRLDLLNGA
jgi:hypothetical protein